MDSYPHLKEYTSYSRYAGYYQKDCSIYQIPTLHLLFIQEEFFLTTNKGTV